MDSFNAVKTAIESALHNHLAPWTEPLERLEEHTGVSRFKLLLGLLLVVSCGLLLRHGPTVVGIVLVFLFPLRSTVAQLAGRRSTVGPVGPVDMIAYWATFAAVHIAQRRLAVVTLVPLYNTAKTAFLAWCYWHRGAADVLVAVGRYLKGSMQISYD